MMPDTSAFGVLVLGAPGLPDAQLAIAASRSGAIGALNFEFALASGPALAALERAATYGRDRLGVLVGPESVRWIEEILAHGGPRLEIVMLSVHAAADISALVDVVRRSGRQVFLTVTTLEAALAGQTAGVDALVVKGHEAGGWVGEETSFVLLQRLRGRVAVPIWVHGGIGVHTAAACYVAGAAGVVLDGQVLLTRESPLGESVRARVQAMDGSETMCLGAPFGAPFRVYARPGLPPVEELRQLEARLTLTEQPTAHKQCQWGDTLRASVDWRDPAQSLLALGQDAAFAADLAQRFCTVGGVVAGLRQAIEEHVAGARQTRPLAEHGPLARAHGTRYPIVQGPMTRVSDRAEFAAQVAEAGALPFLALALMRGPEVRAVLEETQRRLGEQPWGVGVLGFVPPALRAEQLEVIRAIHPPFALIAGGRPDQAALLEREGIPTYLHVPSPGLLELFLREGARRFVFEGRECGGHVGPRTSFVLWEMMIEVLLRTVRPGAGAGDYHVLFAGGVHDGLSAGMVSALAAPLAKRGVRLGVLLGTAYLFTEEAVRAGAITPGFQRAAVACDRTVLLESGPGHATRCLSSPFAAEFEREQRRLLERALPAEDIRARLEMLNVGRLRIAAKGVDRNPRVDQDPAAPRLVTVSPQDQWERGLYMLGQVAALRESVCSLAELHREVAAGSVERLDEATQHHATAEPPPPPPSAVAIVGIGCILPGAGDLETFWTNILNKVDAITEVPENRWDWRLYYDPDRMARDKVYSRWGGFIADVPFDPVAFGMPPNSLASVEPFQLLALLVAQAALRDAGYGDRPFPRERTSVVLGAGGGGATLTAGYMARSHLPTLFGDSAAPLVERLDGALPEWTEDSFPGILMNVAAGRIANRLDLGGVNYTVDAACASSLAAIYLAVRDLEARTSDVVIAGGIDAIQNPFAYLCFSKSQALSPNGRCRTFDAQADGIAISEGFAALVLKRLEDAERDGDRIYAVIRGVGGASDGRDRSLTAPRPDGQIRALRRAYAQANFSPATVELVEAHGTGTVAGDQAEVQALTTFFAEHAASRQGCAIGSVKSMIGHTKGAAGVAGLIKVALALYHRVLPPTLGVTEPNPKANFAASPFYVNSETRSWIHAAETHPRRAGVSAFGFGGTDFHVAVEEYTGSFLPERKPALDSWPAEILTWKGDSRDELLAAITRLAEQLEGGAQPQLRDLAYTTSLVTDKPGEGRARLAIVAETLADLVGKLRTAATLLQGDASRQHGPRGIHYSERPLAREGPVAFLFPGQGSQYVNMARDLAVVFPEVRACFERADGALAGKLERPLSRYIFPPPAFQAEEERRQQEALTETSVAQPALGATDIALLHLLRSLGVDPEMAAGHSYGEFVALAAAGCLGEEDLFQLSEARGRFMREGAGEESGAMAAVDASPDALQALLSAADVTIANLNAPQQTVVSGARAAVRRALDWCNAQGLRARLLPVSCAFHSSLVAPAQRQLAEVLAQVPIQPPRFPVFSNATAAAYPADPEGIVEILTEHLVRPVQFVRQVEAMYEAGARVFVESGPRTVLSGLVDRILGNRAHVCVPLDQPGRRGLVSLLDGLAALFVEGAPLRAERLYEGRSVRRLDLAKLEQEAGRAPYTATTWLVNGARAWPAATEATAAPAPIPVAVVDRNGAASPPPTLQHAGPNGCQESSEPAVVAHSPPAPTLILDTTPLQAIGDFLPAAADEDDEPVLEDFQHVMRRFLQAQKAVMLAYLED